MPLNIDNFIESKEFSEFLFDNIETAIMIMDEQLIVRKVNNSYLALFQKENIDAINQYCGNSMGCLYAVEEGIECGSTSECEKCELRQSMLGGFTTMERVKSVYVARKFYIKNKPVLKYLRIKIKNIKYDDSEMLIVAVDDVTDLEEQKNKIKNLVNIDFLTNLYNRRYLYEYGDKLLENAKRGNIRLAVVMIDIDFFKKINDLHGHSVGDCVLASLSLFLKSSLRKADVVIRYGGEEFCLLLNTKEHEDVFQVIEKIRVMAENHIFECENNLIRLTISCGISFVLEDSIESMIKKADLMLYKAKEQGRNRTFVYENKS